MTRWRGDPGGVPVGLDELDVLARAGRGDLHEHVATVSTYCHDRNRILGQTCHYKKFSAARQPIVFIGTRSLDYAFGTRKVSNSGSC
jgi:hypothetical protein